MRAYDAMVRACAAAPPSDSIELDMRIKIIDGDTVIADTAQDGGFLGTCAKFERYVRDRFFAGKLEASSAPTLTVTATATPTPAPAPQPQPQP